MFIGRERELNKLNKMYQSEMFEFAVLYGRRRVGKTTLIREFMRDKEGIFYMSIEGTKKENLQGLSKAVLSKDELQQNSAQFRDFEALLEYIDIFAKTGNRLIIAIDEYPYLAASYPSISSMLQSHIDNCWKDSKLFFILCGSSMSFMEEQVLGYKSPLYGRRTAQFKIHPFTFFEARKMLPDFSKEEQAILYGATGGIPEYLSRVSMELSVHENLIQLFFEESGRLFEEPVNLMKQELKDIPFIKQVIAIMKGYVIDRDDVRQSMKVIQQVSKEVSEGKNFMIFPEGTRSRNGNQIGEFKGGSFKSATKAKCPIIPVAIIDSYKAFDTHSIQNVIVQVHYLEPMYYEEYKDMKTTEIAEIVKNRIQETINKNIKKNEKSN